MNTAEGRDGALRRPRRVQRRNPCVRCANALTFHEPWTFHRVCSARYTGGDGAARRPYRRTRWPPA